MVNRPSPSRVKREPSAPRSPTKQLRYPRRRQPNSIVRSHSAPATSPIPGSTFDLPILNSGPPSFAGSIDNSDAAVPPPTPAPAHAELYRAAARDNVFRPRGSAGNFLEYDARGPLEWAAMSLYEHAEEHREGAQQLLSPDNQQDVTDSTPLEDYREGVRQFLAPNNVAVVQPANETAVHPAPPRDLGYQDEPLSFGRLMSQLPLTTQLRLQEESFSQLQTALSSYTHQLRVQQDEYQRQQDFLTRGRNWARYLRLRLLDQQNQRYFN
ncbi:hypothetical protein FSARC_5934 [Fusarium sarcochroum]|uniref:Uncharacterized protein n=1 Tax=Fusarium sarcochroum TaxID=1208366 RepID=A0A8H4X9W9_9HYPO|nr:hypothetical protein FSARC_5934 [Fusarium sarcochroum]